MNPSEREMRERHFVEEMGLFFEQSGATRMMGRVLGRLLICHPPHQSSAEIADYLQASRGAISMTTQQLLAGGLIERVPVPNERSTFFRIDSGGWVQVMRGRMGFLALMREIADRGLAIVQHDGPGRGDRLRDFRDFYAFCEDRFPALFEEWERSRSG